MKRADFYFFHHYRRELAIFSVFFLTAMVIVVLHLLLHPVRVLGMDTSIFYMDEKYTLAAFFSTVTAFLTGYLFLENIKKGEPNGRKIVDLASGFFFIILSFDEYFEVHEYINTLIKSGLEKEGMLKMLSNFSWIFPLSLVIIFIFFLLLLKMRFAEKPVRLPMLIGAFCFFGVLIFELLGSATYGKDIYVYYVALEEGLEMISESFFLLAALIEKSIL